LTPETSWRIRETLAGTRCLRQVGEECHGEDPADAGGAPQEVVALAPRGALADHVPQLGVGDPHLALEVLDMRLEALLDGAPPAPRGLPEPVPLRREHLQ
jgi:hypothetical protein